jgi:hypothetical protein
MLVPAIATAVGVVVFATGLGFAKKQACSGCV